MKVLWIFISALSLISLSYAVVNLEKVDVKILDPTKGKCTVTINPTTPKTVNIDVESLVEARDITVCSPHLLISEVC